jgi:hypothetical protein
MAMSAKVCLVLGAPDPEMDEIERIARKAGCSVGYATHGGQRVSHETAYQADGVEGIDLVAACDTADLIMVVECEPVQDSAHQGWIKTGLVPGREGDCSAFVARVDHHLPGYSCYGRPPKEFLAASSLGQVMLNLLSIKQLKADAYYGSCFGDPDVYLTGPNGSVHRLFRLYPEDWEETGAPEFLGNYAVESGYDSRTNTHWLQITEGGCDSGEYADAVMVPRDAVLAAAADHCLAAAYQGECPGVDPDELGRWRIAVLAEQQGRSEAEVLADVERARAALRAAPRLRLVSDPEMVEVADMREQNIPELLEAAARENICFVASQTDRDGRIKIVCQVGSPAQIQAFQAWAKNQGLVDIYGDSSQGFAGGYLLTEMAL